MPFYVQNCKISSIKVYPSCGIAKFMLSNYKGQAEFYGVKRTQSYMTQYFINEENYTDHFREMLIPLRRNMSNQLEENTMEKNATYMPGWII